MSLVPSIDEDHPLLLKKIKHFSHDHPLILRKQQRNLADGVESPITCYGCVQPISGLYYGCDRCMFFLDKSCAQLPREITHFSHPNHPLTLLPNPPNRYDGRCGCDVCREECNRFTYHCSDCNFDVDAKCASVVHSIPQMIDHKSHNHQLIPLQKSAVFVCDACGTKHEGPSYLCTTCGFWINQICASSPLTVKLLIHHHPLTLVYSINCEPKSFICAICDKELYRSNWIYRCSDCDYYVHINCAANEIKNSRATEIETEQHDLPCNSIKIDSAVSGVTTLTTELSDLTVFPQCLLPVPDESVDLYAQIIKEIRIPGKYKDAIEIKHGGHPHHSLIFVDEEMQRGSPSGSDKYCNGCRNSIWTPFYRCRECDFFFHEWCAELPDKLIHPCHPQHPLFMMVPSRFWFCDCCLLFLGGTCRYGCDDCEFFLDMKCASLPRVIRHEAHKHDLALLKTSSGSCIGCNAPSDIAFQCDACKINICTRCALLPRTVRHRYDEHTFTLTYSAPPEDDFCAICEENTESDEWFYHCGKCVQSLHTKCILPIDEYSNITNKSHKALRRIRIDEKALKKWCLLNLKSFSNSIF